MSKERIKIGPDINELIDKANKAYDREILAKNKRVLAEIERNTTARSIAQNFGGEMPAEIPKEKIITPPTGIEDEEHKLRGIKERNKRWAQMAIAKERAEKAAMQAMKEKRNRELSKIAEIEEDIQNLVESEQPKAETKEELNADIVQEKVYIPNWIKKILSYFK